MNIIFKIYAYIISSLNLLSQATKRFVKYILYFLSEKHTKYLYLEKEKRRSLGLSSLLK